MKKSLTQSRKAAEAQRLIKLFFLISGSGLNLIMRFLFRSLLPDFFI